MRGKKGHLTRSSVYLRSRSGIESAKSLFRDIWYCYYPRLWVFVRQMPIRPVDVDDVMQGVMLKVYENLCNYNARYAFTTWVYTIARNHCLDTMRKEQSRSRFEAGGNIPDIESPYPDPEEALLKSESGKEARLLISTLSRTDQQIAFLRFFEERSYREISRVLGIPTGTLKYRVHTIRRVLEKRREDNE